MPAASDLQTSSLKLEQPIHGPTLLVLWEGGTIRQPLVAGRTVVVGRGDDCDVQVLHPSLSRRHLAIHFAEVTTIEDLGSKHGTRVGATTVRSGKVVVPPGAVIEAPPVVVMVQLPEAISQSAPSGPGRERLQTLVAKSNLSVLVLGETGVGKELAAHQLHTESPRASGPLVKINCAALAENLLESELFGHERGAFTGADRQKPGLFELAHRGTLFLDEVSELTASTQAKLLRVLESKELRRVGGTEGIQVDVRIIAASNRELLELVRAKTFREDLYYRLNGISLRLPPLRERLHELPALVAALLQRHPGPPQVSPEALALLARHRWPGNVRELRNVLDRAVVVAQGGRITPDQLLFDEPISAPGGDLKSSVDDFERKRVIDALAACNQNQTQAAKLLGITRRALIVRLDQYDLPRPRKG